MSTHDLIARLRSYAEFQSSICSDAMCEAMSEAADLIEQQAARIAELEARCGEPVAYFVNDNQPGMKPHYSQISEAFKHHKDVFAFYTYPPIGDAAGKDSVDAARYRWLRDTLHGAKAGGGVEVNDALQVYEKPVEGEEVRIYWYQHTPVGFYEQTAATIDAAIDAAIASLTKPATGEKT